MDATLRARDDRPGQRRVTQLGMPAGVLALVVVAIGGYAYKWSWTGFDRNRELWDALHVVVLPIVLATLPLWYRTRDRWKVQWRLAFGAVVVGFALLVAAGYWGGWEWTGFQGNTLWDWLELLALPLVVASLPLWFETHVRRMAEWRWVLITLLSVFALTIVGGYALGWGWTGFRGNTLFDWLRLLMVPFVLPASLAWLSARRPAAEHEDARRERATA